MISTISQRVAMIIPATEYGQSSIESAVKRGRYAMMSSKTVANDPINPIIISCVNRPAEIRFFMGSFFSASALGLWMNRSKYIPAARNRIKPAVMYL